MEPAAVSSRAIAAARDDKLRLRFALGYPLLVCGLAVAGTLWVSLDTDPLIRDVEDSFREPPAPAFRPAWSGLGPLEATVLAGGALAAIGLTAWILRLRRGSAGLLTSAARCDVLADLVGSACPADERGRLAGEIVAAVAPTTAATPPLVAFAESQPDVDARAELLRATAAFYRGLDVRRRRRLGRIVPVVGSLVAGIAVLAYGLALFRPLAGLLESLAAPRDTLAARAAP